MKTISPHLPVARRPKNVSNGGGMWPAARPDVCIIDGRGYVVRLGPTLDDGSRELVTVCIGPVDENGRRLTGQDGKTMAGTSPQDPASNGQADEEARTKIPREENHGENAAHAQPDKNTDSEKSGRGRPRKDEGEVCERTLRRRRAEARQGALL